jgi:hypothetical protein
MLINVSNHASTRWSLAQKTAAERLFGEIRDLPFPAIDPQADLKSIIAIAQEYVQKCQNLIPHLRDDERHRSVSLSLTSSGAEQASAVHVMGEMTFVYQFVKLATEAGLACVASTTERIATDHPNGTKTSEFRFVRFREYEELE